MKNSFLIIGLFLLNIFIGNTSFAQSQKELKPNKKVRDPSKINEINNLQIFFKIDTTQKKSEKGLQFSIRVINPTSSGIRIKNPLDILTISLSDSSGKDVSINDIQRSTINTQGVEGKKTPRFFQKFDIKNVKRNGKEDTSIDLMKTDIITIPAKELIEIFFSINKINNMENGIIKPRPNHLKLIPKGNYTLNLIMSIISAKNNESSISYSLILTPIKYGN